MAQTQTKLVGNLLDIRQAGQNQVLVLSQYQSSPDYTEPAMDIMAFARSNDQVKILQDALDKANADAKEGDKRKAVKNVQLLAHVEPQTDENGFVSGYQLQLQTVLSADGEALPQPEKDKA